MIQLQSKLKIIDNSGGSVGRCIRILTPHGRKHAGVGDVILVSIIEVSKKASSSTQSLTKKSGPQGGHKKEAFTKGSNKRGTMSKALVVRTKCHGFKNTATFPDANAVILIKSGADSHSGKNLGLVPVGSRIKGPISNILKLAPSSPIYPSLKFDPATLFQPCVNLDAGSLYSQIGFPGFLQKPKTVHPSLIEPSKVEEKGRQPKLGEAAIQYQKILALSKLHY